MFAQVLEFSSEVVYKANKKKMNFADKCIPYLDCETFNASCIPDFTNLNIYYTFIKVYCVAAVIENLQIKDISIENWIIVIGLIIFGIILL